MERAAEDWRTEYAAPVLAGTPGGSDPERGRALFEQVRSAVQAMLADLQAEREAARVGIEGASAFLLVVGVAIAA
ncbi:MAG TPA: histidine kinase, partial [Pseudonocardia sp.]|nr:histidine kinase [Pseudonocardia sp.]